ncbi:PaaX family transcriptional regulator [Nocardiopsis baichengensis]|uniref:PaaX family transcriptional regulator n=1 Tax=Nocardiopsis baichengensis TaxID=280240 RepID=UPI000344F941|nr:PaaX family transcriptional regulator C-terminal domain-containing protein [Nocardiopsis baichengensis]
MTTPSNAADGATGTGGADGTGGERRNRRPRSLIVSFFGAHGRRIGGWVSVSGLIGLMGGLDVDPPAVRSAVSRLKRRGLLEAERRGGTAGYRLSEEGVRILADGDRRIFDRRPADLADGWVLVVFSIPEAERGKRHLLRARLAWLGFGTTAAGVWIAPAHLAGEARRALNELEVSQYAQLFSGHRLGFGELSDAVADWWDLDALQEMYQGFLDEYEPVLARWRAVLHGPVAHGERGRGEGAEGADPAPAFADHLRAVDAWRRMPFLDPGLPPEVLPAEWAGVRAARLFGDLHALLREPALRHVESVAGPFPGLTGPGPDEHRGEEARDGYGPGPSPSAPYDGAASPSSGTTAVPTSSTRAAGSNSSATPNSPIAG